MLKIQFKDRRKPAMWLVDSSIKIGKDPKCDIVVDEAQVDAIHCELVVDQSDITLKNLSPNRSVFVNDTPVTGSQKLVAWDIVRLGKAELEIIDPLKERSHSSQSVQSSKTVIRPAISEWMLKANSAPLVGQFFQVNHSFTIGRDEKADIVVPLSFISRIHVKLVIKKEKLYVEDASSSNGTYVNDEKIKACELRNNDELRLDEFSFLVVGPELVEQHKPRTIVREKKEILDRIKKTATKSQNKPDLASGKVFLHDIDKHSAGKVYEIVRTHNHLSKMLGHHLSTSEKSVSARHIYLSETDLGWEIVNNGASDGLLINDRMQIRAILQDGDEIIVGGTKLKFQSQGEVPLNYFKPRGTKSTSSKLVWFLLLAGIAAAVAYTQGWINF
jgi:pSer/pThr/pTyr-binding forkhead associated (FHA) protein